MPAFNVVGTFFGIGQTRVPDAVFPRMLLLIFIWFCLIVRTAYQGVFFEMMTTDMRKPFPITIDDIINRNYEIRFPMVKDQSPFYSIEKHIKSLNSNIFGHPSLFQDICFLLKNEKVKTAFAIDSHYLLSIIKMCRKMPNILEEKIMVTSITIICPSNHFLYPKVKLTVSYLTAAGILQNCYNYNNFLYYRPWIEEENNEPQVLTLENLSFGFYIWLGTCAIAILSFWGELIWFYLYQKVKKLMRNRRNRRIHPMEMINKA